MANVADFQCYPILFNRSMKKTEDFRAAVKANFMPACGADGTRMHDELRSQLPRKPSIKQKLCMLKQ